MAKAPVLSVVIPSLNCAKFIGRSLRSLHRQTYGAFEVVVADGGSVDGTLEIVSSFSNTLDVRAIHVGRGSIGMARNRGIAEAHGKYVCFLDADDCYLRRRLELATNALEADDSLDGLFTSFLHYDSKAGRITEGRVYPERVDLPREIFRHSTVNLNTLTVRRHSLEDREVAFSEGARGRLGEDWDFAARLVEAGCKVGFMNVPTAVVVKGHTSHTTVERQWKMKVCALLTLVRARGRVPGEPGEQARAIQAWLRKTIVVASLSGRPLVARKLLTLASPPSTLFWLLGLIRLSRLIPHNVQRRLLEALLESKALLENYWVRNRRTDPSLEQEIRDLVEDQSLRTAYSLEQGHDAR